MKNWGGHVFISWKSNILNKTVFEGYNKVGNYTTFGGFLGKCSYIGEHCNMRAKVGRFSSIAYGCETITGRHTYKAPYVSTSPLFVSRRGQTGLTIVDQDLIDEMPQADKQNNYDVIIGSDCWIGYKVDIVSGVKIGDGAVVLSRAFVAKDVPPYAIVGGVPAKIIDYRYSDQQIKALMDIQWWNFDLNTIIQSKDLFLDIDNFIQIYKNNKI